VSGRTCGHAVRLIMFSVIVVIERGGAQRPNLVIMTDGVHRYCWRARPGLTDALTEAARCGASSLEGGQIWKVNPPVGDALG
jgi:hypothetical protein